MIKVAILDYGIGNVKSIGNALNHLGAEPWLTSNASEVHAADALILPGVGAFASAMNNLDDRNLIPVIKEFVSSGKPFMGICLGMQLLFDKSEEFGNTNGLGLIRGNVIRLPLKGVYKEKLPHVSWNELKEPALNRWNNTIFHDLPPRTDVYFVHSYTGVPTYSEEVLAWCNYGGVEFCAAVQRANVVGVQFHPEKSGSVGLKMLSKFIIQSKTVAHV